MLECEGEENTFTENAINDEIFMFQRKHVVFHDLRKGLTMDETANETKEKEGVPVTKGWGLIKLAVAIVGLFWIAGYISTIVTNFLFYNSSLYTFIIKVILGAVGHINEILVILTSQKNVVAFFSAIMILPVFAFIQKKKRKSTLKAWGFRNPKGEGINIVISLLGTFIIFCLSRYIYRESWFPFSDSFNILHFLALIPLCIISEVTQEIGFRGMVQAEAMDRLGRWRGVIFASFIFTLFHLSKLIRYIIYLPFLWQSTYCPYCPSAPLYIDWRSFLIEYAFYFFFCFLYGLLWGYLYSRNRNLASPIAGHIFVNTLATIF